MLYATQHDSPFYSKYSNLAEKYTDSILDLDVKEPSFLKLRDKKYTNASHSSITTQVSKHPSERIKVRLADKDHLIDQYP